MAPCLGQLRPLPGVQAVRVHVGRALEDLARRDVCTAGGAGRLGALLEHGKGADVAEVVPALKQLHIDTGTGLGTFHTCSDLQGPACHKAWVHGLGAAALLGELQDLRLAAWAEHI